MVLARNAWVVFYTPTSTELAGACPARIICLRAWSQGITAVVKELHLKFPMVDYHDGSLQLAVGSARPAGDRPQAQQHAHHTGMKELPHAAADEEPIAVFDMRSGAKTRVLHFGSAQAARDMKDIPRV